jgi:hypothetical protein
MWLMTKHGFFSVVAHRDVEDVFLIRARRKSHLQALKVLFASRLKKTKIKKNNKADYKWRMIVKRDIALEIFARLFVQIDYPNFKNEVQGQPDYHKFLSNTWLEGLELQDPSLYKWKEQNELQHF